VNVALCTGSPASSRFLTQSIKVSPLSLELRHFLECVFRHTQPSVSGQDGLAELDTAIRIRDQAVCSAAALEGAAPPPCPSPGPPEARIRSKH
jgi:hypothetical protein